MDQHSQQIADRYQVELSESWRDWFNHDSHQVSLAGEFRQTTQHEYLLDRAPAIIWPGLMLPDSLPIVGNEYGDWICVRVDEHSSFGELIHWYHGGGDWVPVGESIAEAALHDAVDQFRPRVGQVLRGAAESTSANHLQEVLSRLRDDRLQSWLRASLVQTADQATALEQIVHSLAQSEYFSALKSLAAARWSWLATSCDEIEYRLQSSLRSLTSDEIWKRLGMNYEPDFVRWLFDLQRIPNEALHQIQEVLHALGRTPISVQLQDWQSAESLASQVLSQRADLAWAVDIAGWSAQRRGDFAGACQIYFSGRFASSFSNQSVRLRSHGFDSQFGKVALAELWNLRDHLTAEQRNDGYVQKVWQTPERLLQREIQEFWMQAGQNAMRDGQFAIAYENFYRAGWDLGAQRMTDYIDILGRLIECADAAGWNARAAVAATHLACLAKLTPAT